MKKKMYLITKIAMTMFVSDAKEENLESTASSFLEEEMAISMKPYKITVKEIKSMNEVPNEWKSGALLWGTTGNDMTPELFLQENTVKVNNKEYRDYLRLKAKFED